jgi:hypothetical protein
VGGERCLGYGWCVAFYDGVEGGLLGWIGPLTPFVLFIRLSR